MVEKLKRYKAMLRERDHLETRLEEIETSLYFPGSQRLSDMPSTAPDGNPREELAIKHIELQARYKAITEELDSELQAVEDCISRLSDPTHRTILRLRYIDCAKVADICERLSYSRSQIHRLEKAAFALLEEMESGLGKAEREEKEAKRNAKS